jgi:hypothetical protein
MTAASLLKCGKRFSYPSPDSGDGLLSDNAFHAGMDFYRKDFIMTEETKTEAINQAQKPDQRSPICQHFHLSALSP